jgi:hypothetical protein
MQLSTASHGMAWHGMAWHRFAHWFQSRVCLRHSSFGSSSPPTKTSCTPLVRHCRSAAQLQPHCYVLWRCRPPTCLPACAHRLAQRAAAAVAALPPIESANCRCVCTAAVGQALVLSLRVLGVEMPSPSVLMPKPLTFGHVAICVRACAAPGHTHTHTSAHTQARTHKRTATRMMEAAGTKTIRLLRHLQQCTA